MTYTDGMRLRRLLHSGNPTKLGPEGIERLRAQTVVPHGYKCRRGCGATLVPADPLPHRCMDEAMLKALDFGKCLL